MSKLKSIPIRLTISESNPLLYAELARMQPRQRARWLENTASAQVAARMIPASDVEALVIKLYTEQIATRPAAQPAEATHQSPVPAAPAPEPQPPQMNAKAKSLVNSALAMWPGGKTSKPGTN